MQSKPFPFCLAVPFDGLPLPPALLLAQWDHPPANTHCTAPNVTTNALMPLQVDRHSSGLALQNSQLLRTDTTDALTAFTSPTAIAPWLASSLSCTQVFRLTWLWCVVVRRVCRGVSEKAWESRAFNTKYDHMVWCT